MKSAWNLTCTFVLLAGCAHGPANFTAESGYRASPDHETRRERKPDSTPGQSDEITIPHRSLVVVRAQGPDDPGLAISSDQKFRHDPRTERLIELEIQDLSSADQLVAREALKVVPANQVPAVLRMWRAGYGSPTGDRWNDRGNRSSASQEEFPYQSLEQPSSPGKLESEQSSRKTNTSRQNDQIVRTSAAQSPRSGLGRGNPWKEQSPVKMAQFSGPAFPSPNPTFTTSPDTPSSAALSDNPQVNFAAGDNPPGHLRATSPPDSPPGSRPDEYRVQRPLRSRGAGPRSSAAANNTPGLTNPPKNSQPSDWAQRGNSQSTVTPAGFRESDDVVSPLDLPEWNAQVPQRTISPRHRAIQSQEQTRSELVPYGESRSIITPPDWTTASESSNSAPAPFSFNNSPKQFSSTGPTGHSLPSTTQGSATYRQFPRAAGTTASEGIVLSPGQVLPGFSEGSSSWPQFASRTETVSFPPSPVSGPQVTQSRSGPQTAQQALQFLIQSTESEVRGLRMGSSADELQFYVERHVHLRLLYLMAGQTESALRPIPGVPAADQEFWTQVLWGIHNYFDLHSIPNPTERASQTISQFNSAILKLKERAPLVLRNAAFSRKIDGYGEFESYPHDEFAPGQRVLVYCEIDNYHSDLTAEGIYRTRLTSTLQFLSEDDPENPVETKVYPVTEDFCRNHRRDYFHSYVVDIPARCIRGAYGLKLIVQDELSGKTGATLVPFAVR